MILKSFSELTTQELYSILELRQQVFIIEQNCPYDDLDFKDQKSHHLLWYNHDELQAYARILPPGVSFPEASIGRIVVKKTFRGGRTGKELIQKAIEFCNQLYPKTAISISAQFPLETYYAQFGFRSYSEVYDLDGIPHINMRLAAFN